jgi:hypothetical protein
MKKPTKKTAKRKGKAGGRRRTGDKASSASAKLLALVKAGWEFWALDPSPTSTGDSDRQVTRLVKSAAGSALVQDEHRGRRGK